MQNKMFSIVCVYNNKEILENTLLASLKKQTKEYELILVDNTKKDFRSAASALNYGGKNAKGKYIMFVHQDVELKDDKWLEKAEEILENIPRLGIAGVTGTSSKKGLKYKDRGKNMIWTFIPPRIVGKKIEKPEKVQSLDELLVIIPKQVFEKLKFDEKVCDDWHLYAVDYCLSVRRMGLDVYVIPMLVYHKSLCLSFSEKYYITRYKLARKHMWRYCKIYATMGGFYTWLTAIYPPPLKIFLWKKHKITLKNILEGFHFLLQYYLKKLKN